MFRFSSFATKGKSRLSTCTRAFSSIYEAHLNEQQLLRVNQNLLDILLWIGIHGFCYSTYIKT